jgi:C1A family cysteine protease
MRKVIICVFITMLLIGTTFTFLGTASDNITNKEKLLEIKKAITDNNAKWTAGFNSVFTPEGGNCKDLLGCIKEETTAEEPYTFEICASLPDSFDWRNVDGTNYVTSIKSQRGCGSCVAFGTLGALEAVVQIEFNETFDCDLSEAHLFFCGGGSCDRGWYNSRAADFVEDIGVADEMCFPYEGKDMDCDEKASNWKNRVITANAGTARRSAAIKEALIEYGPVLTAFTVYEDFGSYTGGIYEHVSGAKEGGHAVAIVGYNDDSSYWICKNSWGEGWGENGFFRIKYRECGIDDTAYYFDGVNGNIQPFKPKNVFPYDRATNVDPDVNISWNNCEDIDGDTVTYTIFMNEGLVVYDGKEVLVEGITNNYFQVEDLDKNKMYSFKVIAEDEHGSQHASDDITFVTRPPSPPTIEGPTDARIRRECTYTASTTDDDGEEYYWFFKWGDDEDTGWLGPYNADDKVSATHTWDDKDKYIIKVRYKEDGLMSDWTTLEVSMPKNKVVCTPLLHRLFDRYLTISTLLDQFFSVK